MQESKIRLHDLWPRDGRPPAGGAEHEILRRAIELFGRRGYGGTSTRSIAAEASVTAPLIGYHFGSKEGLFRACSDVVMLTTTEAILETDIDGADLRAIVRHFAQVHLDFARDYSVGLRFVLTLAYGPEEGQPTVDLVGYWRPVIRWLAVRMHRAVESGELEPRPGATPERLMRYLFNLVHMDVMSTYEEQRFLAADPALFEMLREDGTDRVDDLVDQFFAGAGVLHEPSPEESNR